MQDNNLAQWEIANNVYRTLPAELSEADKIARLNQVMPALLGITPQPQIQQPAKPAQPTAQAAPTAQQTQLYSIGDLGAGHVPAASIGQKNLLDMTDMERLQAVQQTGANWDKFSALFE